MNIRTISGAAGLAVAFSLVGASLVSAAGGYTVAETGIPVVAGNTVNLTGIADAHPYIGSEDQQHVSIDWDNNGNWIDADSFDPVFAGIGSDKFFEGIWTGTHTYATPGAKTVQVKVYHGNIQGAEGSDASSITIDIVIDVCPNLIGAQESVPDGYTVQDNECVPTVIPPTDVCPNIDGVQESVPDGMVLEDGQCVPIPITTGTLVVRNAFASGATDPSQFSFSINDGDAIAFNTSGENDITEATGTYAVVEVATSTYAASYDGCSQISITAGATSTCMITNTFVVSTDNSGGNSGGGDNTGGTTNNGGGTSTDDSGGSSSSGGSVSSGPSGGGNGPIAGSLGGGNGPIVGSLSGGGNSPIVGQVLGASTTTLPFGPSCELFITGYLRMGAYNDPGQVKRLQQFLNDEMQADLPVSGFFGSATFKAVKNFQMKYSDDVLKPWVAFGLASDHTATGYVYKTTARKINLLKCVSLDIPMPQLP